MASKKKTGAIAVIFVVLLSCINACSHYEVEPSHVPGSTEFKMLKSIIRAEGFNKKYAILIDMSLPSYQKRLFLIDIPNDTILYETWVAHGKGSGTGAQAVKFSNDTGSYCTSLGVYTISSLYNGKHGLSYRLEGQDETNSNAQTRDIVFHSADYVSAAIAYADGRVGNSWGCPVVSPQAMAFLRKYIKKGMVLKIYTQPG